MVGNENKVSNYYSVSNGQIVRSYGGTKPEDVETTERVNKNGNTVYEQLYDFIQGKIIKAELKTHDEYGDSIILTLASGGQKANLQIKFDSAYGRSLLYKIPNINLEEEIKITPYSFVDKESGKTRLGLTIYDPLEKVPNYYTKDDPNGMPQLKKVKFKGKDTWDNTDQIAFLKDKFAEFASSLSGPEPEIEEESEEDPF